jgi:hypothetical protein
MVRLWWDHELHRVVGRAAGCWDIGAPFRARRHVMRANQLASAGRHEAKAIEVHAKYAGARGWLVHAWAVLPSVRHRLLRGHEGVNAAFPGPASIVLVAGAAVLATATWKSHEASSSVPDVPTR